MNDDRIYTIIAGINGAGKTSLYRVLKNSSDLGKRINIDEMVMSEGDWQDTLLQIRAGRYAMQLINEYIEYGVTFHQETTLPGNIIIKQIKKAKANGFKIRLYYIGVDDINTAIDRVHKRVEMGGHGVDDRFIIKRNAQITKNLKQVLPLCDIAIMFDNTVRFRQIAVIVSNKLIDWDINLPNWFIDLLDEIPT